VQDNLQEAVMEKIIISLDTDNDSDSDMDISSEEKERNCQDNLPECKGVSNKVSDPIVLCGICGEPERVQEDMDWIGCDMCKNWFHTECMNDDDLTQAKHSLKLGTDWHCKHCRDFIQDESRENFCSICKAKTSHHSGVKCSMCSYWFCVNCLPFDEKCNLHMMLSHQNAVNSAVNVHLNLKWFCMKCKMNTRNEQ
jgi:hypothetical protein